MLKYRGVNYLEIDSLITDEERLIRDTIHKFIDAEVLPIIEKNNRVLIFPIQLSPYIKKSGDVGTALSGEFGCAEKCALYLLEKI